MIITGYVVHMGNRKQRIRNLTRKPWREATICKTLAGWEADVIMCIEDNFGGGGMDSLDPGTKTVADACYTAAFKLRPESAY
jgi:hypothetical protein